MSNLILKIFIVFSLLFVFANCSINKQRNLSDEHTTKKSIQDSLAFELCKIYGSDQGIRDMKLITRKETGALAFSPFLDSINFYKIVDFIKAHGIPSKELVGEENYNRECVQGALVAVLLHTPHLLISNEEYLNVFLDEVEKGNMRREFLADVLDKYYWIRRDEFGNQRLLYGSQFGKPCRRYRKESDSARAVIGLSPLPDSSFVDCKTN